MGLKLLDRSQGPAILRLSILANNIRSFPPGDSMLSDIEIAQKAKMKPIGEIAKKLGIPDSAISPFGHYKAKVSLEYVDSLKDKPDGKLILVTAISPTPAGEGKTTTPVGLGDALNALGKKGG